MISFRARLFFPQNIHFYPYAKPIIFELLGSECIECISTTRIALKQIRFPFSKSYGNVIHAIVYDRDSRNAPQRELFNNGMYIYIYNASSE